VISKERLYEAYAQFCISAGRESHKKHGFMRNMRSLGFKETRDPKTREMQWKGLTLKEHMKGK
jgi:hypothetical protein